MAEFIVSTGGRTIVMSGTLRILRSDESKGLHDQLIAGIVAHGSLNMDITGLAFCNSLGLNTIIQVIKYADRNDYTAKLEVGHFKWQEKLVRVILAVCPGCLVIRQAQG